MAGRIKASQSQRHHKKINRKKWNKMNDNNYNNKKYKSACILHQFNEDWIFIFNLLKWFYKIRDVFLSEIFPNKKNKIKIIFFFYTHRFGH